MKKFCAFLIFVLAFACLCTTAVYAGEGAYLGDVSGGFIPQSLENGIYKAGAGTVTIEKTETTCHITLANATVGTEGTYSIQSDYDTTITLIGTNTLQGGMYLYNRPLTIVGGAGASLTVADDEGYVPPFTEGGLLTLVSANVTIRSEVSTSDVSAIVMDSTSVLTLSGSGTGIFVGTEGTDPRPLIGTQIIGEGFVNYNGETTDGSGVTMLATLNCGDTDKSDAAYKYNWDASSRTLTLQDGFSITGDIDFEVDGNVRVVVRGDAYVGDDFEATDDYTVHVTVTGGGTLTVDDEIESGTDGSVSLTIDEGTTLVVNEEIDVTSLTVNGTLIVRDGSSPLIDIEGGTLTVGQYAKLDLALTGTPDEDDELIRFSDIPAGVDPATLCNIADTKLIEIQIEDEYGEDVIVYVLADMSGKPLTSYYVDNTPNTDDLLMMLLLLMKQSYSVTTSANEGGTITADAEKVKFNKSITVTVTPDEGFRIADVLVDGKSVGAVSEYTCKNMRKNHTIEAVFERIPWENPYADVTAESRYYEDVRFVSEKGLMIGAEGRFDPEGELSRAMFVTVLWRLAGEPVVNYILPFGDVSQGEWYSEAVRWAAAQGIVKGDGAKFAPDAPITREEMAVMLYRYEQQLGGGFKGMWMFRLNVPDREKLSDWAYEAACYWTMHGVYPARDDGSLAPAESATRAEAAALLRGFCEKNG